MKTKHYLIIGTLGIALAGSIFAGCKKDTSTNTNGASDYTAAQDDANATFVVQDSKNISDGAAKGQAVDRVMSPCATITKRDTNNHQDSLLDIYFGATDCLCTDLKLRRGHILVWWTKAHPFSTVGDTIFMGFNNYYVQDIGVTGLRSLATISSTTWSLNANLTLTYPTNSTYSGGTATWQSQRTYSEVQAGSPSLWYWEVTGGANGRCRSNATYTITITSPLYVEVSNWVAPSNPTPICPDIESGSLTITVSTFTYPIYVTFGTAVGTCSQAGVATINGHAYNFYQQ
jgi:hypothetical protein